MGPHHERIQALPAREIDRDRHLIKAFPIPQHWTRIMGMDWGACGEGDPFHISWWAVSDGSIPPDQALGAIKAATNLVLNEMADKEAWGPWRTAVGEALTKLQQEGSLTTKAHYVAAFREIASGLNAATGHNPASLRAPPANGILDGIDIAKIIELIKLILELLKLFGGG